jgi:uncharacterized membrane protein
MTGWTEFVLAMAAFLASHFLPVRGGLRDRLINLIGRRAYFAAYGVISVLVLVWLVLAAGRAPYVELWVPDSWTRQVPLLAMPVAVFLAVVGVGSGYPHTLGGRRGAVLDVANPGLAAITRHPLFWALSIWSAAHLPPKGDLAHVIMFGGFCAMGLAAMPACDRRATAALGAAGAAKVFAAAPILSPAPLFDAGWLRDNRKTLVRCGLVAAAIWGGSIALHETVIGVSPLPS